MLCQALRPAGHCAAGALVSCCGGMSTRADCRDAQDLDPLVAHYQVAAWGTPSA